MTRENYIHNLQSMINDAEDMGLYDEDVESLQVAIKALEQEPRWIPVSERLPDKSVEVLATTIWGDVTIAERFSENDWFINEGNSHADMYEIIVWMPLPKPYMAESEE